MRYICSLKRNSTKEMDKKRSSTPYRVMNRINCARKTAANLRPFFVLPNFIKNHSKEQLTGIWAKQEALNIDKPIKEINSKKRKML